MTKHQFWTTEERQNAEETWLTGNAPEALLRGSLAGLEEDQGIRFERKLRLFGVACVRRLSHLFKDERTCHWLDALDEHIEGLISDEEQDRLGNPVIDPPNADNYQGDDPETSQVGCAWEALCSASEKHPRPFDANTVSGWAIDATYPESRPFDPMDRRRALHNKQEGEVHSAILREIFNNPFRPITINPAWLTPTVNNLATVAYEEHALPSGELDTARLSVLADALEEAGCTDTDILGHLRSPGPHVRGCWAVDLLLGKE
jgi:hypothetical protein